MTSNLMWVVALAGIAAASGLCLIVAIAWVVVTGEPDAGEAGEYGRTE